MKNILVKIAIYALAALPIASCSKAIDGLINSDTAPGSFVQHTIILGQHSSNKSGYSTGEFSELHFLVKFDSSAIYSTSEPSNQHDINKLFGFSDNDAHHHQFSARIGWRWSDGALRLFGYIYNGGISSHQEISSVAIGKEIDCSIIVRSEKYIFRVNDRETTMPRTSPAATAVGYRLYPYFGGDEPAPHDIHIWIKEK